MQYIEAREVTITVTGTSNFEMTGTIEGSLDSFKYQSTNSYFIHWFPEMEIDSLKINKKTLNPEQIEIVEACEKEIKELIMNG